MSRHFVLIDSSLVLATLSKVCCTQEKKVSVPFFLFHSQVIMNHGSLPFIRLIPMVYQSGQEDHAHYPSHYMLPGAQKPCFHLAIWVRQAHQGRRQQWAMEVLLPLSADICVLHCLDYTGGFRVHTWQRRCSWGHIRLISSPGFCQ